MLRMTELGNGRATIREIAELAGVSIATVSRVVNGREDVSPETRELVQRVVRERGYTANRNARGLHRDGKEKQDEAVLQEQVRHERPV